MHIFHHLLGSRLTKYQRLGVYTSLDHTHILESLIQEWGIANISSLSAEAEKSP